jgi:gamma-glutamyl hercynylcysteine S-oxide synthase
MRLAAAEITPREADSLIGELSAARRYLLDAAATLPDHRWAERPSPSFSPVGWHLGHAAATQARWLLAHDPEAARFGAFFDPTRTRKEVRFALPSPDELRAYLGRVASRLARRISEGRLPRVPHRKLPRTYLARHFAQHDLQHGEHILVIGALCEGRLHRARPPGEGVALRETSGRVEIEGGPIEIGSSDAAEAYDNERPAYRVRIPAFWLSRAKVTVAEYAEFVASGGYDDQRLWSEHGWSFRLRRGVEAPAGWIRVGGAERFAHPDGAFAASHPVTCLSWFEADAYARFRGARLPTEEEWECARRSGGEAPVPFSSGEAAPDGGLANVGGHFRGTTPVGLFPASANGLFDASGNVWEWTSSWFLPYPGFTAYPYDGYSTPWFGTPRVLRGGSWATAPRLCRVTFRNWYEPGFRDLPAGLRCAGSL